MLRIRLAALVALAAAAIAQPRTAFAQHYRIDYTIALTDPASHLYAITLYVAGVAGRQVELQMPVWSPGRYGKMDFARNVQDFAVSGADGKPLRSDKINGSRWRVNPGASRS